jgi:3-deoxy-D-arabino-heptulosonate 7-phosphate (DAHP) synthase class II
MDNSELMDQYKAVADRIKKAKAFMDGPGSINEKEFYVPQFQKLIHKYCELAEQLGLTEDNVL